MKEEIGKRIREIRENMHMTKESFAKALGISGQYLGIVERGGSFLSVKKLKALCDLTGLSADYILFGRDKSIIDSAKRDLSEFTDNQILEGCIALEKLAKFIKTLE